MNATLNELLGHALQPGTTFSIVEGGGRWVETFIHPTEKHELFGKGSLYRRTTGFQGELAFDVGITNDNPPNVLIIGVESFRYEDSHYLVGEKDPSNLFKGTNITITPNFDKWAKRGVALRNIWSSSPTSRSLESLLFAQIPYDSTVKTGITGGRKNTKLSGLPQLFKQKGYETFFTTGCPTRFENWDVFLPAHGYETVWDSQDMMKMAERDYSINHSDWHAGAKRGLKWGVHDDINLQLLGDLLVNKTSEQSRRVANGEPKKPMFATHYTISSHAPFEERPTWYANAEKPDFSFLYKGEKQAGMIKNYLEMRYFADMELGKFMDRMEKVGVLNDTIVVIVGDHGQAPEAEITNTHEESVTRVAGAIIAEGRLGNATGMVIEDAVEQYDILNTLADITGLPEGGFVQNGVGRSLKRKVPFGERVVFSNDPSRKMSIVRGHQRLRYDQVTASMMLHDTEADYAMTRDLFPGLTAEKQVEWENWRDYGRRVTAYYTKRWDENCLLSVSCTGN
ncbi:Sulfatase-like protein [Phytophthora palmivora]|uniref:Sulfatase-like protein n=1 Tax=Phytophthora palmivora TaxID=4796 RepID=A0A2P4Y0E4_9STRA|nr:Sulfatase-like protein [Phytophthora palmivora]